MVAIEAQHNFFIAANFAGRFAHDFYAPALVSGVTGVHARQIASEQGRFITARASTNFHKSGAIVIGVFRQQEALQLGFDLQLFCFAAVDFFLRHLGHIGVLQQILCSSDIAF